MMLSEAMLLSNVGSWSTAAELIGEKIRVCMTAHDRRGINGRRTDGANGNVERFSRRADGMLFARSKAQR